MIVVLPDRSAREILCDPCTIRALLERFGINPIDVIVSVNGNVSPEDTVVGNGDQIRIIRIAHGG